MLEIAATLEGTVTDSLKAASERLANFAPLLEKWGEALVAAMRRNIDESRSSSGAPFLPLKNPRAAGHNQSGKPLYDSGALYQDLQHRLTLPDTVRAGSSLEYAVYQNKGTRTIPARPFISGLSTETVDTFRDDMAQFIASAFNS